MYLSQCVCSAFCPSGIGLHLLYLAGRKLRARLLRELADEVDVSQELFECVPHFEVTEEHYADTLARFGYFPSIQSITVRLDLPARPTFRYQHENFQLCGRKTFDFTVLEATCTLQHLSILSLDLPSGDCLCALPREALSGLRELRVQLNGNGYQGTFAFLPRLASLEVLKADLDFFSVCCLRFLTNLRCLDMSLAPPEHGHLTPVQACERNNEALLQIARLSKLENLQFFQPASEAAVAQLSVLTCLTRLQLRLPYNSEPVYSSLWDVQKLFQHNTFGLQHLHYEFMLGAERGLACLSSTHHDQGASDSKAELQFSVPWSTDSVIVEPLGGHELKRAGVFPYSHREALSDPEGYLARDRPWELGFEV